MKQHDDYRPQARPRQTMSTGNLLLLLALLGWALPLTRTERTLAPSSAGARGEPGSPAADATARLKQAGHCDSLMQAMQAARYAVETAPAAPATGSDAGCYADNPAQALRCWFRAEGLEVQSAGTPAAPWKLNLRLRGYGRETLEVADAGTVSARQNRVELSHASGTVVEWYENQAAGLEQGFTMRNSPAGGGPLRLLLAAEGDLRPEPELVGRASSRAGGMLDGSRIRSPHPSPPCASSLPMATWRCAMAG